MFARRDQCSRAMRCAGPPSACQHVSTFVSPGRDLFDRRPGPSNPGRRSGRDRFSDRRGFTAVTLSNSRGGVFRSRVLFDRGRRTSRVLARSISSARRRAQHWHLLARGCRTGGSASPVARSGTLESDPANSRCSIRQPSVRRLLARFRTDR